jgi:hypothetical protein
MSLRRTYADHVPEDADTPHSRLALLWKNMSIGVGPQVPQDAVNSSTVGTSGAAASAVTLTRDALLITDPDRLLTGGDEPPTFTEYAEFYVGRYTNMGLETFPILWNEEAADYWRLCYQDGRWQQFVEYMKAHQILRWTQNAYNDANARGLSFSKTNALQEKVGLARRQLDEVVRGIVVERRPLPETDLTSLSPNYDSPRENVRLAQFDDSNNEVCVVIGTVSRIPPEINMYYWLSQERAGKGALHPRYSVMRQAYNTLAFDPMQNQCVKGFPTPSSQTFFGMRWDPRAIFIGTLAMREFARFPPNPDFVHNDNAEADVSLDPTVATLSNFEVGDKPVHSLNHRRWRFREEYNPSQPDQPGTSDESSYEPLPWWWPCACGYGTLIFGDFEARGGFWNNELHGLAWIRRKDSPMDSAGLPALFSLGREFENTVDLLNGFPLLMDGVTARAASPDVIQGAHRLFASIDPSQIGVGNDGTGHNALGYQVLAAYELDHSASGHFESYDQARRRIRRRQTRGCTAGSFASTCSRVDKAFSRLKTRLELAEDVNEHLLLHGTSGASTISIAATGFDASLGKDGAYFGRGAYFAEDVVKSDQYTRTSSWDGVNSDASSKWLQYLGLPGSFEGDGGKTEYRVMMLCRVTLGCSARTDTVLFGQNKTWADQGGNRNGNVPLFRDTLLQRMRSSSDLLPYYDSVHTIPRRADTPRGVRPERHREFVVYRDQQAMPVALIVYRRTAHPNPAAQGHAYQLYKEMDGEGHGDSLVCDEMGFVNEKHV